MALFMFPFLFSHTAWTHIGGAKMWTPHLVPLNKQAVAILAELQTWANENGLIFTGAHDPRKAISENTLNNPLRVMGYGMTQPKKSVVMDSGRWRAVHWIRFVVPRCSGTSDEAIRSIMAYVLRISIKQNIWKNIDWCYSGEHIFWMRTENNVSARLNIQRLTIH